jgi:dATP pyrophosphohydrolase
VVRIASGIVEVCIFAFTGDGPEYLMLRRSPHEKIYPDIWQFVTGSIEGAETATRAALREMAEETALVPTSLWVVPHVNTFYDPSHDSLNLTPVFAAQVDAGRVPKLSAEHTEYRWCDRSSAEGLLVWPGQRLALGILHDSIVRGGPASGLSRIQ